MPSFPALQQMAIARREFPAEPTRERRPIQELRPADPASVFDLQGHGGGANARIHIVTAVAGVDGYTALDRPHRHDRVLEQ